jgi:hypothetical protein
VIAVAAKQGVAAPESFARADAILLALPLAFAGVYLAVAAVVGTGVPPLAAAAVAASAFVADGVFLNPPVER